jgi:hypothetical protein
MDTLKIRLEIVPMKLKIPYEKLSSFAIVLGSICYEDPYELAAQVRFNGEFEGVIPHAYPIIKKTFVSDPDEGRKSLFIRNKTH